MLKSRGDIAEPCGTPTLIGRGRSGEPGKRRLMDRSERKDMTHWVMYSGTPAWRRREERMLWSTKSKPPLMSRNMVETLKPFD
jgi:hypothetical protein